MGVDGTVNGRNNLDKSVSASPSSQLATVGSGTVGGGEGGLWVGANGGGAEGDFHRRRCRTVSFYLLSYGQLE